MTTTTTSTTCPYCGVGCGVRASLDDDGKVRVAGDPQHPANRGRLCSKGAALADTIDLSGRLLHPQIGGRRASWATALDAVAEGFRRVIAEHGPEAVAIYGSGQLLTEDYYVANKLMKGFIGSANIDTNSRLSMASSVVGHQRAFGADAVPGCYQDLEQAELVVLVGSNLAWCHPVLYQRLKAAREANPALRVVVIDPRRTETCELADLHLAIAPGSDVALFNGLLHHLQLHGHGDAAFLAAHTEGAAETLAAAAAQGDPTEVASACGLAETDLLRFYRWFAAHERSVTVYSQGVNQSSQGSDKVNAIINCHLYTGRIGRPGMGPLSVTGQPNAMGGREVGGLASLLAAHMGFEADAIDRVRRFWDAPNIATAPGLKTVDLFAAIGRGEVKAVWIMATNPVVSLPDADAVRAALAGCELVVVSDCVADTDTLRHAHIRLPALTWGEKDGTVTNSERRISRQRAFLPAPGAARPDWWMICEVARRLGFGAGFDYAGPWQIFREHARLSAFENGGRRAFDIGALAELDAAGYQALQPFQWPLPAGAAQGRQRLYANGGFHTAAGRARLLAVTPQPPAHAADAQYPLVLNTGRVRDHWHTLTRTGKAARLCAHTPEPCAELHPLDAARLGIGDGEPVRLRSRWGEALVRARHSPGQRSGSVFVPMHWSGIFSARARIDAVVSPARDPLSGEPEFKHTPVRLERAGFRWHAFVLSRETLTPVGEYWTRLPLPHGSRLELAGNAAIDWRGWARAQLGAGNQWLELEDAGRGILRLAAVADDQLQLCLFVAADPELPERDWLADLFTQPLRPEQRLSLLSGQPPHDAAAGGPTVCSCFGVGAGAIGAAVRAGCQTTADVTRRLKAGGNCGSCLPEIQQIIAATQRGHAA